jgi:hypothetical protein
MAIPKQLPNTCSASKSTTHDEPREFDINLKSSQKVLKKAKQKHGVIICDILLRENTKHVIPMLFREDPFKQFGTILKLPCLIFCGGIRVREHERNRQVSIEAGGGRYVIQLCSTHSSDHLNIGTRVLEPRGEQRDKVWDAEGAVAAKREAEDGGVLIAAVAPQEVDGEEGEVRVCMRGRRRRGSTC